MGGSSHPQGSPAVPGCSTGPANGAQSLCQGTHCSSPCELQTPTLPPAEAPHPSPLPSSRVSGHPKTPVGPTSCLPSQPQAESRDKGTKPHQEMPLCSREAQPNSGLHTKETEAGLSPLGLGPVPTGPGGSLCLAGARSGCLGLLCPLGRDTPAIHLRLFDVFGSGIAAHPQRFVVVHHDVQLFCGVTGQGGGG